MKLYFFGHDYKYAAEQMLLTLFPEERPEYPEGKPEGERIELSLVRRDEDLHAICTLVRNNSEWTGEDSCPIPIQSSELETDRLCQRILKNAMYRAALNSGLKKPEWGALTGVRPGKILCNLLRGGMTESTALNSFISDYDVSPKRASLCMDTARVTLRTESQLLPNDVCLYIGIPFCPTRCAYCSFVSQSVEKSMKLISPFLEALLKEVHATAEQVNRLGLRPISVYMGGGTPTTLSANQLNVLCSALEREFDLSQLREYTVEAGRPDTITVDKLRVLKSHGVDRVSVNPQTMSDSVLETIGRKHTAADIVTALEKVREIGGFSVNMDLIAGLPSDTAESFRKTLETVLALNPENITVHTLSLKKGSGITMNGAALPTGDEVSRMLEFSFGRLAESGYSPYYLYRQKFMSGGFENIGWTKQGYDNLYNICIMEELCSIIAMGGGGSTKLVAPGDARNIRVMAPKYPQEYIQMIDRTCSEKQKIAQFYTREE